MGPRGSMSHSQGLSNNPYPESVSDKCNKIILLIIPSKLRISSIEYKKNVVLLRPDQTRPDQGSALRAESERVQTTSLCLV